MTIWYDMCTLYLICHMTHMCLWVRERANVLCRLCVHNELQKAADALRGVRPMRAPALLHASTTGSKQKPVGNKKQHCKLASLFSTVDIISSSLEKRCRISFVDLVNYAAMNPNEADTYVS